MSYNSALKNDSGINAINASEFIIAIITSRPLIATPRKYDQLSTAVL